ncbi:MAG: hypothetical protein ACR2KE_01520 [Candidatus Nanopelagicales bacterium]
MRPWKSLSALAALAVLAAGLTLPVNTASASTATASTAAEPAVAPTPRANTFPERFSVNAAGDLAITGNTLMTCPDSVSTCAEARQGGGTSARFNNNSYSMVMVDIDADPTTINSSSADLLIPTRAPILFAGLYWGAGASGDEAKGQAPANAGSVKFKTPGSTSYTSLTAAKVSTISTSGKNKTYAAVADVTSLVAQSGRGTYTVADVKGDLGVNHFVGWSLIVVYGDPTEPVRAMSVFDGMVSVSSGSPATIDVSGFKTPPTGPVRTALGVVAYEGDLGITGDQFELDGKALSNSVRPADNFFNSTVTTKTALFEAKSPNYRNQLGFDTGLIDATGRIANNATKATFRASSTGDQYYPAALTFSTELFSPRYDAVKSVVDLDGDAVRPGDILEYTMSLKNDVTALNGDASSGTVITDTLPAGATYVPGSLVVDGAKVPDSGSVATVSGGVLTVRVGTGATATGGGRLAIGASTVITYRMQVGADTPGNTVLANDFRVAGTAATSGFAVTGISNEAKVTVVANGADLSIVKTAATALVAGQTARYSLAVSNAGPGSAESVVVKDAIPAGLEFVSATGTGWSCVDDSGTLTCDRPSLPAGASAPPITLTVAVPENSSDSGSIVNTATVTSETPDPDPGNNSSTTTTPSDRSADLAIHKWHEGTAIPGDRITYTLAVRNEGPSQATGITVSDPLPTGLALVSATGEGWSCTGTSTVTCARTAPLEPGESAPSISVVADVLPSAGTSISNTATVTGAEPDPTPGNNSSTDGAETERIFDGIESVSHPGKAVAGGPAIPVTVRAYNAGPGSVPAGADAVHTITLPRGTSLASYSGAGWTCTPATGAATASPLTVTCHLPLASDWAADSSLTPLVLQVAVAAGETQDKLVEAVLSTTSNVREIDTENNRATDIITLETSADLALATTSSAALLAGGPAKPLIFTVTNNGPATDPGPITVRFSRLHGLRLAAAPGSPWVCTEADGRLLCVLTGVTLEAGQQAPPLALEVSAPDPEMLDSAFDLTGIVSSPQPDADPANDSATAPITVTTYADIWTAKTASPATVTAGDTVTYTLTVSNGAPHGGPSVARDVSMTDDLGALGLVIESVTAETDGLDCSASTETVVSCFMPMLGLGSTATARVVARTDPAWFGTGRAITNVVRATSSTPGGDRPPGSATITTNQVSTLTLSKTVQGKAAGGRLDPGAAVTYVMQVGNAGPADAQGATVTDVMPTGITPSVAVGNGWACTITGQQVSCTTPDVLPVGGSIPPILISGLIDPDARGAIVNGATVEPESPGKGDRDTITMNVGDIVDLDIAHYGPTVLQAGETWQTTVGVRNNGPATEPGPIRVVIDQTSATPKTARGEGWDCTVKGQRITCVIDGPLAMGASLPPIRITSATSPSGTQVTSVATVSGKREDSDRTNNRSATSAVLERPADIAVRKRATTDTVEAGGRVTFEVTVTNKGPGATADAQAVDVLPAGLTWLRGSSDPRCANETGPVTCSAGETLKAGESTTFRIVAAVATDARGSITNAVVASSSQPDPDPSNNRDRTTITVTPPAPPEQPQQPLIDPPDTIKDSGTTEIYDEKPPTNAGQTAKVQVSCQPLLTQPRGDFTYCTVTKRSDGSIWIFVPGTSALQVKVRITAPAVTGYSKMDITYVYTTKKVR